MILTEHIPLPRTRSLVYCRRTRDGRWEIVSCFELDPPVVLDIAGDQNQARAMVMEVRTRMAVAEKLTGTQDDDPPFLF